MQEKTEKLAKLAQEAKWLQEKTELASIDMKNVVFSVEQLQFLPYYDVDPNEYIREEKILEQLIDLPFNNSDKREVNLVFQPTVKKHPIWESIENSKNFYYKIIEVPLALKGVKRSVEVRNQILEDLFDWDILMIDEEDFMKSENKDEYIW